MGWAALQSHGSRQVDVFQGAAHTFPRCQQACPVCLHSSNLFTAQDDKTGQVLQLDLRDHKQRRLALLVQRCHEPQLFEQLLSEATRRFDRYTPG